MDFGLVGKVAIVTGATQGLGRAEALALAREGALVAVHYLNRASEARGVLAEIQALGSHGITVQGDLTVESAVEEMQRRIVSEFGRLDILVANAGSGAKSIGRPIVDIALKDWQDTFATNTAGTFLCIKHFARPMIAQGWGRIVNTSSFLARGGATSTTAALAAAKAAIVALTEVAAKELGPHGVNVNAIAPTLIRSEQLDVALPPGAGAFIAGQFPLRRLPYPEEIAKVVVFLASSAASYVNGTVVDVNGGRREYYLSRKQISEARMELKSTDQVRRQ